MNPLKQIRLKPVKFGCIAPIELLDVIPTNWKFHLILAHLLENTAYVDFYKKRQAAGDILLLDNSAFEFGESLNADLILKLIKNSGIKPDYVVAPDYPGKSWEITTESTFKFIERCSSEPFKVMGVPQSESSDWMGWLEGYKEMINHPKLAMIGMSILGVPNAFRGVTGTDDIMVNRLFATNYILQNNLNIGTDPRNVMIKIQKWHHYLGLGQPRELLFQRLLGLMDSNDSSSPVWHGLLGINYDNSYGGLINGKSKIPVDFHIKAIPDGQDPELVAGNINFNIQWINELISSHTVLEELTTIVKQENNLQTVARLIHSGGVEKGNALVDLKNRMENA